MRTTSNNPALNRIPEFQAGRPVGFHDRSAGAAPQWQAGAPAPAPGADPLEQAYFGPTATSQQTGRMTVEDVVIRTGLLFAVALVTGAGTWVLGLEGLAFPALFVGLVLGLVIAFKQITKPAVILTYAAVEGVFLGGISKFFEAAYPGIVVQAVGGTAAVTAVTLFAYRSGRIRVTPQFQKMVMVATGGFLVLILGNLVFSMFTGGAGLRGGTMGLVIGAVAVGLAAMNLVLDFDMVDKGSKAGMPERFGWFAAFGLMVTLVWMYIEILRILAILRGDD